VTTAEDYSKIASAAYGVDALSRNPPWKKGKGIPPENPQFVVVSEPLSDPVTGFQGMAVAPLENGVPDYSQVYVSFAGTNPGDHADIGADAMSVVGRVTAAGTQAAQAVDYAKVVSAELLKDHPEATFSTVGHSLGGFLAMYVGGELHWSSTTFNGPDPWDLMSPQAKKWLKEQVAAGKKPFLNYVNEWDLIGNLLGNETGAAEYVQGKPGKDILTNHNIDTGFSFGPDGAAIGAGADRHSLIEIMENQLGWLPPRDRSAAAAVLAGAVKMLQNPSVGAAVGKTVSAVMVAVDTIAATSLASSIFSTSDLLRNVKSLNSGLIPQMEVGLRDAQSAASAIPYITQADIENCVATHRLRVHQNIDEHAVAAVDRLVDDHLATVHKLSSGIGNAVANAGEQDLLWAKVYGG
jgi:hypothetical protein